MNNFAQRHSRDAKPFFGGTYMEEAAIDKLLTPEDKEDLKKAFCRKKPRGIFRDLRAPPRGKEKRRKEIKNGFKRSRFLFYRLCLCDGGFLFSENKPIQAKAAEKSKGNCIPYYFLKTATRSAQLFFLITNQRSEKPPVPATATEPITIPTIAPAPRPSALSLGSLAGGLVAGGSGSVPGFV